ncbi:hypothetical protein FQN53_009534 [Emmonsiellopsis sp. PD_33]|nr:hypothetical protein FQN53_009534 [Emmonsiellopsis sp. PD_33]
MLSVHLQLSPIIWATFFHLSHGQPLVSRQVSPENGGPEPEGGTDFGIIPGSIDDPNASGDAGAAGTSKGSVNLSTNAQIAIIVVVSVVVVLGATSAILFYLAKKKQWEVRASIRRSARRLTGSMKARSSNVPSSSKTKRREGTMRIPPQETRFKNKVQKHASRPEDRHDSRRAQGPKPDRDVEKPMEVKTPTGKSEFEDDQASPRGWTQVFSFNRNR